MKVTAYIPCFNNEDTLAQAITSVRAQGNPIDQLFVLDDCSTDRSCQIARDAGVEVIAHRTNLGRGAVRAAALQTARHELVLSCDAGLVLAPNFLEKALTWLADQQVIAAFGRVQQKQPRNASDRWRQRHLFKVESVPTVNRRASLATGGLLLRRSAVMAAGNFDVTRRAGEDFELGQRLLAAGHEVVFDPELITHCETSNTLKELLERYRRWNVSRPWSWMAYLQQTHYSWQVMLRQDLSGHDFLAAAISLLCPHYLFWTQRSVTSYPSDHLPT